MRANLLKKSWAEGKATVNGWLGIPNAFSAETMAHAGWDSLTVDMQHGLVDYQAMVAMLQAISTTNVVPMVRVPWNEPGIVQKCLDAGSYGIICPMINTRAECEQLVSYCRYAPAGTRSFGPIRASVYAGADYFQHANETVLTLAMIETRMALENLDDILSVPGLDGIYVGPADLAISLGVAPGFDPTDQTVLDAIRTIVEAAKRHGLHAGLHCGSTGFAKKMIGWGFDYVTILGDGRLMAMKALEVVAEMKKDAPAVGGGSDTY